MSVDIDKTTEARRKAARNGEEDPFIVAQRYLNIYRQMHIFSPERKESFDKMLLELSPEIIGLFSSLPGGAILQDYIDDLAEKNGIEMSVGSSVSNKVINSENNQQSQILATALASSQSQNLIQPQIIGGNAKVSMDKDFAEEFAKVIEGVLQQQVNSQKEAMEKLALDISKTQMFIAKSMKESKEEQRQDIAELCKTISSGYQTGRNEQRQEFDNLCKAIIKSQTALSTSLVAINNEKNTNAVVDDDTKALIKAVIDEQKQINTRLEVVEKMSSTKGDDNAQLIAAFEKSQTELIRSLQNINQNTVQVVNTNSSDNRNDERLIEIISESQEKLIKSLMTSSMLQSIPKEPNIGEFISSPSAAVVDNSAQMMVVMDKLVSLQEKAGQNLEKAIVKVIEEQSKLYDKINSQQTKDLAEIISSGLSNVKLSYTPNMGTTSDNFENNQYIENIVDEVSETLADSSQSTNDIHINEGVLYDANDNISEEQLEVVKNHEYVDTYDPVEDMVLIEPVNVEFPKKKKKKKKKKKNIIDGVENNQEYISEKDVLYEEIGDVSFDSLATLEEDNKGIINPDSINELDFSITDEDCSIKTDVFDEKDISDNIVEEDQIYETLGDADNTENKVEEYDIEPKATMDFTADDWGISPVSENNSNDNNIGLINKEDEQEWAWEYVEDDGLCHEVDATEVIGSSYICIGNIDNKSMFPNDLNVFDSPVIDISSQPLIYDEGIIEDDGFDPYQNSILKD